MLTLLCGTLALREVLFCAQYDAVRPASLIYQFSLDRGRDGRPERGDPADPSFAQNCPLTFVRTGTARA